MQLRRSCCFFIVAFVALANHWLECSTSYASICSSQLSSVSHLVCHIVVVVVVVVVVLVNDNSNSNNNSNTTTAAAVVDYWRVSVVRHIIVVGNCLMLLTAAK